MRDTVSREGDFQQELSTVALTSTSVFTFCIKVLVQYSAQKFQNAHCVMFKPFALALGQDFSTWGLTTF